MAKWAFLFSQLIHFLMKKNFSIFRKNNFEAFEKIPPLCGSLLVYVETKQGWAVDWGTAFDLKGGGRIVCRALYGRKSVWV